jgi:hypothetical protein
MNLYAQTAVILAAASVCACTPAGDAGTGAQAWRAPRTSWGDPNIEGSYTNRDENGTPFERPADLDGRRLEEFGPTELVALNQQRLAAARARAPDWRRGRRGHGRGPAALVRAPRGRDQPGLARHRAGGRQAASAHG